MIKHHGLAHLDKIHFAHLERILPRFISSKSIEAYRTWLPAIGAEALLLASFLLWLQNESIRYHGLALLFAWVVYGLIAMFFLYLWIEPTDEESAPHQ
jgi:hypothetical protein